MKKIGYIITLLLIIVSVIIPLGVVNAVTIIIAANDSDAGWKVAATAVCDAVNDEVTINTYLTGGATVELAPGTYEISDFILPNTGDHLYGQGNTTILNLNTTGISIVDVNNVELDNFKITGSADGGGAIFLACYNTTLYNINIHDIVCMSLGGLADYEIYANASIVPSNSVYNIIFSRCDAINPDGFGFYIGGEGTTPAVNNIVFYKCTAENAAVAVTRTNIWAGGFDFCEGGNAIVTGLYAIDCVANGSWESNYYMEDTLDAVNDLVITGCDSQNAGQKVPAPVYGNGYLVGSVAGAGNDVVFYGNTASTNIGDDLMLDGTAHTPVIDGISPIGSTKTAVNVSQGNVAGVLISLNATHRELVLYSTDANPVNQQIELGGYFASDDGNVYTFSGTKVTATFDDYAVMRLVETSAPAGTPTSVMENMSPVIVLVYLAFAILLVLYMVEQKVAPLKILITVGVLIYVALALLPAVNSFATTVLGI
jgi:hypothetical protein